MPRAFAFRLLPAVALILSVGEATADELTVDAKVAGGVTYLSHTRASDAPLDTTEKGALPALAIEATTAPPFPWIVRARLGAFGGPTAFRLWQPTGELHATTHHRWLSPEVAVGGRLEVEDGVWLGEYVGFGYTWWRRSVDLEGQPEWTQRWASLAIGTVLQARLGASMELVVDAALVPSFAGAVHVENDTYGPTDFEPVGKLGGRAHASLKRMVRTMDAHPAERAHLLTILATAGLRL